MELFNGIIVFAVIWWIVLFMVLPLWVTNTDQAQSGNEEGAPDNSRILLKFLVTTIITIIIWVITIGSITIITTTAVRITQQKTG